MSPKLRNRNRYPEDASSRSLRNRLNLLILLFIAQMAVMVILWLDVSELKSKLSDVDQATSSQVMQKEVAEDSFIKADQTEITPETLPNLNPDLESDAKLEPKPIVLQVLNGCGVGGVAAKVSKWLEKNSYKVKDVGNADRQDYRNSQIIDRSGNLTAARELATLLGINEKNIKRLKLMPKPEIDLTLILGKDHRKLLIGR